IHETHPYGRDPAQPQGHGHDGAHHVPRERAADRGVQSQRAGQHHARRAGSADRHHGHGRLTRMAGGEAILKDGDEKMKKSIEVTMASLSGIRTGRANPGLVESMKVDYYGQHMPLKQL